MTEDMVALALAEVLGLSESAEAPATLRDALRSELQAALASTTNEDAEDRAIPTAQVGAFLEGTLGDDEAERIRDRMLASPVFFDEVMALADYLDETDALVKSAAEASLPVRLAAVFTSGTSFALRLEPKLRSAFETLVTKHTTAFGPLTAVVAAASNKVDSRRIEGGSVSLHPSTSPNHMVIVCVLDRPDVPCALYLKGADGEMAWEALPEPRADGSVLLVKRLDDDEDSRFVRLFQHPSTKAGFHRINRMDRP